MARPKPARKSAAERSSAWLLSALMLVAIGCATATLGSLLVGIEWWITAMVVATLVLGAAAVVRSLSDGRWWPTLAGFLAAVFSITGMFAPGSALAWIIPTIDTFDALRTLERAGVQSISTQSIPANADSGITYLVCLGIAAIAFLMDTTAHLVKAPALAGIPLLVLLLVPGTVLSGLTDPFLFTLTAAAYLAMLLTRARPGGRRVAVGIGAATIVAALVVPLALPGVQSRAESEAGNGLATGINPIVTLGDDLRRGDPKLAITYTTTSADPVYLRLSALDDFTGVTWKPTATTVIPGNTVDQIGPAPGLGEGVATVAIETDVTVGQIISRWLPVPYAPESITGLEGNWSWEPDGLSIRTEASNARGQEYTVSSVQVTPSIDQLVAAGTTVEVGLERYLDVPEDLPAIVAETAATVVGDAASNYDKAIALQSYFTGGEFTYSESAPVDEGYDGSGASVLDAFLEAKAGYCVHFSSAMASMARTLGIPARVAVGFTPGEAVPGEPGEPGVYRVTTHNLHAWPELYFAGIGWVRFEPTPGRGEAPRFAPLAVDDPATPDVDESVPPPAPAPSTAPTTAPTNIPDDDETAAPDDSANPEAPGAVRVPWGAAAGLVALAILLAPWAVRALRRQRRLSAVDDGSALAGWHEVRDTADDLGLRSTDGRTPRQLADDLAPYLDDDGAAALGALRTAVEAQAYADQRAEPSADDVREVLRSLRRATPIAKRLQAALAPHSLFAPWIAQFGRSS